MSLMPTRRLTPSDISRATSISIPPELEELMLLDLCCSLYNAFWHFRRLWSLQGVAVGTMAAARCEETWTFCSVKVQYTLPSKRPRSLSDDACGASINACETVRYWSGALEVLRRMRLHQPWGLAHGKRQKPVLCCETVRFNLKPDVVKQSSALSACQDGHWLVALAAWLMRLLFYGYAQA